MTLSLNVLSHSQGLLCITRGAEEWFMSRGKNGTHFWGISGEDCVWGLGADGWLDIYSFTQRKRIHRIYIGNGIRMRLFAIQMEHSTVKKKSASSPLGM